MALSIGELVGYLRIDDTGIDGGLDRAQARIRGFGGEAADAIRASESGMRAAGERAGAAAGDGIATGAGEGARRAGGEIERESSGWGARLAVAGAGAGAGLGAAFSVAAESAMQIEGATAKMQAQLGLTADESERIGGVAGSLYSNAYGESMAEVGDAITSVMQNIEGMSSASDAELEAVTGQMMSLAQTMQVDVGDAAAAVGQMIRTGLAGNAVEAMDLLTAGVQSGANRFGDLSDTIAGSAGTLAQFGLDGKTSIGLISQTLEKGAPSADFFIGALEELAGNAGDSVEVFDSLGLSGTQMAQDLNAGGETAKGALGALMEALRNMQDPAARSTALVGLFGEEATAMQDALLAVDPTTAVTALGDVAGKSAAADAALGSLASNSIVTMQREAELLGAKLITTEGPLGTLAAGAAAFGPQALGMAGSLAMVGMAIGPLIAQMWTLGVTVVTTAAQWALQLALMAARTVVQVAVMIAQMVLWAAGIVVQGAIGLASLAVTAAGYVAQWVVMAAGAMARAVIMAAAWFIALGPIGWVIAAVIGLVALIIANWDAISAATSEAWAAVMRFISEAWENIKRFVSDSINNVVRFFTDGWNNAVRIASDAWNNIVNAVSTGVNNVLNFVRGIPGAILGALGGLGNLLYSAGRDVVMGLWNGIVGMGTWLYGKIMGWIREVVPGPVLQFLGIASPSKYMRDQVGHWIPEGLAAGILGNAQVASDAARVMAERVAAEARGALASAGAEVAVDYGSITDAQWDQLRGMGYKGRAGDNREALYVPQGVLDSVTGRGDRSVTVNIHNPLPETASDSINRRARTLALLGSD